ncbi:hypothetical protein TWF694_005522 [Orbilia ellipsospora]|uniref:CHAT domain-containing protein n=1 Tax=Orbilia ellipsospora TaxID=2528407 RepID=A0AAV9WZE4_9PEZI
MENISLHIQDLEKALEATNIDEDTRVKKILELSSGFRKNYENSGSLTELETGIKWAKKALSCNINENLKADVLAQVGMMLLLGHIQTKETPYLEEAINHVAAALAITPTEDPNRARVLRDLASCVSRRAQLNNSLSDIDQALQWGRDAIGFGNQHSQSQILWLKAGLCDTLYQSYEMFRRAKDLEEAVKIAKELSIQTSKAEPHWASRNILYASILHSKFEKDGDLNDLEESIRVSETVLKLSNRRNPRLPSWYQNYSIMLSAKAQQTGSLEDLDRAIDANEECLSLSSPPDANPSPQWPVFLTNKAILLAKKYRRGGDIQNLDSSIACAYQAAKLSSHRVSAIHIMHNLAAALLTRFLRLNAILDLENAIQISRQIIEVDPPVSSEQSRSRAFTNFSLMLFLRYKRKGSTEDLKNAKRAAERSISFPSLNPTELGHSFQNLAVILGELFSISEPRGPIHDLDCSIEYAEKALKSAEGPILRAGRLACLGSLLTIRYHENKNLVLLEDIITKVEEALHILPFDHQDKSEWSLMLGDLFHLRYGSSSDIQDFTESSNWYRKAWNHQSAPPLARIKAARRLIEINITNTNWDDGLSLAHEALKLVYLISPRHLDWVDQQHLLSIVSGMGSEACALALNAGMSSYHALEVLELGRGVILGYGMELRAVSPGASSPGSHLLKRFEELRAEINQNRGPDLLSNDILLDWAEGKRAAAFRELQETLDRIRELPGMSKFLRFPSEEEITTLGHSGALIVLNTTKIRSDAIIIRGNEVSTLPMPLLDYNQFRDQIKDFISKIIPPTAKRSLVPIRNQRMTEFLAWLWDNIAHPVVRYLNLEPRADPNHLPRVWWICTGLLSLAPLHAAGLAGLNTTDNVLCRAISSYSPTIRSLISYAVNSLDTADQPSKKCLLVEMPTTPGERPLTNAPLEVDEIARIVADISDQRAVFPIEKLHRPTAQDVIEHLPNAAFVHFACHAQADPLDPSNSKLIFVRQDPNTGAEFPDPLSIRNIATMSMKPAMLAYLSACSSAKGPATGLVDEVLHIASAFQLAGFQHVIGTLWQAEDRACRNISGDFYASFLSGREDPHPREVSLALHKAIIKQRKNRPELPISWAPFVHIGPIVKDL